MLASFKPIASSVYILASLMIAQIYFVRRFPAPGESLKADDFYCETGGKGLNVLIGLHKLGIPVRGIIPCGRNHASRQQCVDLLAQWQLPHISLASTAEYNGNGVALIDAQGQNQIIVHPGANTLLDATHILREAPAIESSDLVYASFELPDAAILAAFELARAAGRTTVLNPSPYREISPELLGLTDILIMNQTEAQAWLNSTPDQLSHRQSALSWLHDIDFTQRHPGKSLIMTLACQGAIAILEDGSTYQQAGFDTNVIDSIGAGDAFASALLASLIQENNIKTALIKGCASASLLIRKRGVLGNLPTPQTLDAFLSGQSSITN